MDITTIASIEKTKKEQQEYKGSNESAVIKIKDCNWENLYNNQNELIDFITPKDLKY